MQQRYEIYINNNIELVKSLIFKSEAIASAMNQPLLELGKVIPNDRREWRYYKHLSGKLFDGDNPIYITSLDTQETIELTIENMALHKKTAMLYKSNSDYLDTLIENYPSMTVYLEGVFYPVDVTTAIAAPDCSILHYNRDLVEAQEQSIIVELSQFIQYYHNRYMAKGWVVNNDCYILGFYALMMPALVGVVSMLRMRKVHTQEAHSFHVEEFLASHQRLNVYLPYLTTDQKYSLYRNIRYWERNSGKEEILEWLVDEFLTKRNMPAVAYELGQLITRPNQPRRIVAVTSGI